MSKHKHKPGKAQAASPAPPKKSMLGSVLGSLVFIGVIVAIVLTTKHLAKSRARTTNQGGGTTVSSQSNTSEASKVTSSSTNIPSLQKPREISTVEVNHAVMVTVELDFGPEIPSIAEALNYIERRSKADDGSKARTFAILDAYGEPTPDKKKLHISMHVSTEKPGLGSLVFTKTKEVLWQAKIVATTNTPNFSGKNLTILLDTGQGNGKAWTIDGSSSPSSILEANIHELKQPVRDIWPDGADREMTFIYSACGCPVKVMVRRIDNRTVRSKELPVIFPDDPAVVTLISQLMGW